MKSFFSFIFNLLILRLVFGLIFGIILLPFRLIFRPFRFRRMYGRPCHRRYGWHY